ncbi:MAG TPA: flagellar hook-associated protein FlgL [Bacillota bacterium]|nr:flagellar hook-associated protein FlgL [Bacillota bacterium]
MGFRVNQNMLNSNMLYNLSKSYRALAKDQEQLSSGRRVNRPSDDPVSAVRGMTYRHSLNDVQQFKTNAQEGKDWMDQTDSSLNEMTQVLQRVRELTVKGSNDTNDPESKKAISDEIQQLKEHLGDVANSEIAGRYIFAGTDTKTAPCVTDNTTNPPTVNYVNSNNQPINWQVGKNNFVQINTNGTNIFDFTSGTTPNVFGVLDNIISGLTTGTPSVGDQLGDLDKQLNNVTQQRSELGARMNRMDLSISRLDDMEVSTTSLLSSQEDTDIAKVITDLQTKENVQNAALSVGARIIQQTLVDFIK